MLASTLHPLPHIPLVKTYKRRLSVVRSGSPGIASCPHHLCARNRLAPQGPAFGLRKAAKVGAAAEVLQETTPVRSPGAEETFNGITAMWSELAGRLGDSLAVVDPHNSPATKLTFRELDSLIQQFAAGLSELGLQKGEKLATQVSLFSENSARWLIADQGLMTVGAVDAARRAQVRGSTSPAEEMAYILAHSESRGLIVQDLATLERALPAITRQPATNGNSKNAKGHALGERLKFVVVLWGEPSDRCTSSLDCPVLSFNSLLVKAGQSSFTPPRLAASDLATLVYTSGTTGSPKGVELTHGNLNYQKANFQYFLPVHPGERTLSLLPPWHIYERACAYYIFSHGGCQAYTSIRHFKEDLTKYPPDHFVCVPLVLDTLFNRVQQQIKRGSRAKRALANFFLATSRAFVHARRVIDGVALQYARTPRPLVALLWAYFFATLLSPLHKLGQALVYKKIRQAVGIKKTVVSGGGSLAPHLDDFFEILGLQVVNGWGLSETSPVLACRRAAAPGKNVRGTVGYPIPGTQIRVVDPETLRELPDGQQGLLLAKGPGVMRGYHNDVGSTQKAMRAGPGWFDTGDLGWRAPGGVAGSRMAGCITLSGRSKDTIVLSNGENIEPQPIEDACCVSPYISHMVVVGQDRRVLGALIAANNDAFEELESVRGAMSDEEKRAVIRAEISKVVAERPMRENIGNFVILPTSLSAEGGTLTRTLKTRRQAVLEKYAKELEQLNKTLR